MCLIKSMTAAAAMIIVISGTAYATVPDYCERIENEEDFNDFRRVMESLAISERILKQQLQKRTLNSAPKGLRDFQKDYKDNEGETDCCQHFGRVYEQAFHNLNRTISALRAMDFFEGVHKEFVERLKNLRHKIGEALVEINHWESLETRLGNYEGNGHIPTNITNPEDIRHRNELFLKSIANSLQADHHSMTNCLNSKRGKRISGLLSGQPIMEARYAPNPAESAPGRWEYVVRENRAFHQQQEPDRPDRDSVDPLDDMVRQIREYDELQEIRNALKRSDELLGYPMDIDDEREILAYDQQVRPRLVAKRNDFLTNTWVDDDAPATYYVEAKRDAETLGPFAESGKRSVRLDSIDQSLEFKRALLDLFSKK